MAGGGFGVKGRSIRVIIISLPMGLSLVSDLRLRPRAPPLPTPPEHCLQREIIASIITLPSMNYY